MGVAPNHPVILTALEMTMQYYQIRKPHLFPTSDSKSFARQMASQTFDGKNLQLTDEEMEDWEAAWHLGPVMLGKAYKWWAGINNNKGKFSAGESYHKDRPEGLQYSYLLREKGMNPNWNVHDPKTNKKIFQSHDNKLRRFKAEELETTSDDAEFPNILSVFDSLPEVEGNLQFHKDNEAKVAVCAAGHLRSFIYPGVHTSWARYLLQPNAKAELFMNANL